MIIASKSLDPAFVTALEGRPDEWKERAWEGYTTRVLKEDFDPAGVNAAREHGLGRTKNEAEREAWSFGFDWLDRAEVRE